MTLPQASHQDDSVQATAIPGPEATPVPYRKLKRGPNNPRRIFKQAPLEELAASIKERGVLQPLTVRPTDGEDRFEIIIGERRYRALGLLREAGVIADDYPVPVTLRADLDDEAAFEVAIIENLQREDVTPLEAADAFVTLAKRGLQEDAIALKTGSAPSTVKMHLKLAAGLCADAAGTRR